ncbi:putative quinol monooxygenase [Rothia sp. CCM 9419]|uniref:putative quinol monooxygenase n=1 Tax=Rothia sp. CCM 9419 TaxID=3402662 RepID=UPI003AE069BC
MIGVFAKVSIKAESIEAFEKSAQALVEATRSNDNGLVSYDFGTLSEEGTEGEYAFIERWESHDALKEHMGKEHFTTAVGEWEEYLAEPLQVSVYDF